MLQIDLDLGDAAAQRFAERDRRRAEPAFQPLADRADGADHVPVPGVDRPAHRGDLAVFEGAPAARAEQQQ